MDSETVKAAAVRAARTFVQAYVGVILAFWIGVGDSPTVTGLWDAVTSQSDVAAGAGIIAAITALGWRSLLDPSPVPSLRDNDQTPTPPVG